MAFALANFATKISLKLLEDKLFLLSISSISIRERHKLNPKPKLRNPTWFTQKQRLTRDEGITAENKEFFKEVIQDRYAPHNSLPPIEKVPFAPNLQRTGLIARKIGIYPMWLKSGKKISTTLLQVLDNHVIKYYAPESYAPPRQRVERVHNPRGCLLLGAEAGDPALFTKEYCGLFAGSGVVPKRVLARFFVSPEAALAPGALLGAQHFRAGGFVDVRGLTVDRGFQGVMRRHGYKGMPASHGVTKTHRRGGNIGGGGEKARVWPGTKMPGHMGNRYRTLRGLRVWRINTKHNVLYVSGQNIPGLTNSIVYVYDSKLPTKRPNEAVPVPTWLGGEEEPEDMYDEELHGFGEPSIVFNE